MLNLYIGMHECNSVLAYYDCFSKISTVSSIPVDFNITYKMASSRISVLANNCLLFFRNSVLDNYCLSILAQQCSS